LGTLHLFLKIKVLRRPVETAGQSEHSLHLLRCLLWEKAFAPRSTPYFLRSQIVVLPWMRRFLVIRRMRDLAMLRY